MSGSEHDDEQLIERLRRAAPDPAISIDPVDGPRATALMEQIMNTPLDTLTPLTDVGAGAPAPRRRRWAPLALGGGALGLAAAAAIAVGTMGGSSGASQLSVALPAGDPMAMCLPPSEYVPTPGLGGFRGTVVATGEHTVTLEVDHWFAGGDADQVVIDTVAVGSVALDGVDFQRGVTYLVALLDGQVLICGLSGPDTPELAALYDTWFD